MYAKCLFPLDTAYCWFLQKAFANRLDPDQARQYVGFDHDTNCSILWCISERIFKKKIRRGQKNHENFPSMQRVGKTSIFVSEILMSGW